ncbi:MAG: nucleotide exchange factor GrpE [Candidatus Omnitrophica bacterium]|nr:nucleotide exchange factor GrpE [Candidatus Omnitrophota bacterium]
MTKEKEQKQSPESADQEELPVEEQLAQKEQERRDLWDKYVRLAAEFDNARKRWDRERREIIKFANFSLLQELLVIMDETEQALKIVREHKGDPETVRGIEILKNNLEAILKRKEVKAMDPKDQPFDPHAHEIVATRESDEVDDEPVVLEAVQKGYFLEDKVLRTAKVIVGMKRRAGSSAEKEESAAGEVPESDAQEGRNEHECG